MAYSMIGSNTFDIDGSDFIKGMSTDNNLIDGGFSIGTLPTNGINATIINPVSQPGILNFPATATDKSTNLTGEMMASCEDPAASAARLFVSTDSGSDGRFFSSASDGTLTQRGVVDSSHDYLYGRTDIIGYQGEAYVTTATTIVRWQQPATFNTSFFSFNDAFAPHPAIVFENNAYYGDGNELHRQTSAGGAPAAILTLPTSQVIVALGIDPGSGRMLISVVNQYNISDTVNSQAFVLYYDGFSNKVVKTVPVDDMITAFYNVGGTVFVGYGPRVGYWTGAGIEFLRKLNVSYDNAELPYKHHFTNWGQILVVVEKNRFLCFGKVTQDSAPVWWYAYANLVGGTPTNMTIAANLGSSNLCFSYATSKFFLWNILSTSSLFIDSAFYSLKYNIKRKTTFNQVLVEFVNSLTANIDAGTLYFIDSEGNVTLLKTINPGSRTDMRTIECPYPDIDTRSFQLRYLPASAQPIARFTIFANPSD